MPNINDHEYSIHSQNGEDGIVSFLCSGLRQPNRRFIEVGCSDGLQNNSAYLIKKRWSGLAIEADGEKVRQYSELAGAAAGVADDIVMAAMKVGWDNCPWIMEQGGRHPDFFSLDIDSVDYYVAHRLMGLGFAPSIICCEYNSFLGHRPLTVTYDAEFARYRFDPARGLYYGASVAAWKFLFPAFGYRFCGVDTSGVNAFFCRHEAFLPGFLDGVTGLEFAYTKVFTAKYRVPGEVLERELLARQKLVFIDVTQQSAQDVVERCHRPLPASPLVHEVQAPRTR